MPAWTRTAPWPGQLEIAGEQYMLRATEAGEMVARKATRLDAVAPPSYDVSFLRPYVERPFSFGPCPDGMGQVRQGGANTRYRHAVDADLSIGGVARLGPAIEGAVTLSGGGVLGFVEANHGGTNTLFALCAGGVQRRSNETTWVVSDAAGLGAPVQAVRYRPSDASAGDFLYVALDTGLLRYYDGGAAVWATAVLPGGVTASAIERLRDELWIGGGNGISKATTDPRIAASWATPIAIGDLSKTITRLRATADQLFVVKQDGVYAVTTATPFFEDLFPELRPFAAWGVAVNGQGITPWRGSLWFPFGGVSYRLTGGETALLDRTGLSVLMENDSEVRGEQTAFAGDQFFGWYAYYDLPTDTAYLVKHGAWLNTGAQGPDAYVFNDVPHGAVRKIVGPGTPGLGMITAMHYTEGFPITSAPNPRLYLGFADGKVAWITLPKNSPDPTADSRCTFMGLGYVYWPDHDAEDSANLKHWRGFSLDAPFANATHRLAVEYRVPPAAAWTALGTDLTAHGQRVTTPGAAVSHALQVRSTLTGSTTTTPEVAAVVLHEQTRPALQLEHDVVVIASDHVARLDGGIDHRSAEQIRDALKATAGPGPTEVWMPDGTRMEVDFVDYAESLAPEGRRNGLAWDVALKLVEFRTL